jgi:hypothetical protein
MLIPTARAQAVFRRLVPLVMASVPLTMARGQTGPTKSDGLQIQAAIEYQYGDEDQGRMDLDPKLGMVAPDLRVWLPGRTMGVALRYLSGDFDGTETVRIPDGGSVTGASNFGSRKEMSLSQSREDVQLLALFRPRSWVTLSAGYRYLEFQMMAKLDLVSDVRTYGEGMESYDSTARGPMVGMNLDLPIRPRWSLHLGGQAMPWMHTKVNSGYSYTLTLEDRMLAEEWVANGSAEGYAVDAGLEFMFPGDRVALRFGYVYQRVNSRKDVEPSWVDEMLGQEARDWRTDRFQGFAASSIFQF